MFILGDFGNRNRYFSSFFSFVKASTLNVQGSVTFSVVYSKRKTEGFVYPWWSEFILAINTLLFELVQFFRLFQCFSLLSILQHLEDWITSP